MAFYGPMMKAPTLAMYAAQVRESTPGPATVHRECPYCGRSEHKAGTTSCDGCGASEWGHGAHQSSSAQLGPGSITYLYPIDFERNAARVIHG